MKQLLSNKKWLKDVIISLGNSLMYDINTRRLVKAKVTNDNYSNYFGIRAYHFDVNTFNQNNFETIDSSFFENQLKYLKLIKRNKIEDSDKVLFLKNSKFPRTSFNRYSDKAKRVEKNATKFVVNSFNESYYANISAVKISKGTYVKYIYVGKELDVYQRLHDNLKTLHFPKTIKLNANRYYNVVDYNELSNYILSLFLENVSSDKESFKAEYVRLVNIKNLNKKDLDCIRYLVENEVPIKNIVTDSEVNRYINQFKDTLTEDYFEYFSNVLDSKSDPEVALQLLTNMGIPKNDPKVHALFFNINYNRLIDINNHKVSKSVDFLNFKKFHQLDCYYLYNNTSGVDNRLSFYSRIIHNLDVKDRNEFFKLTKPTLLKLINHKLGFESVNYIDLRYEVN